MADALAIPAGPHHRSDKDGRDAIARGVVIFVPGQEQQAVVRLRPLHVAIEVTAQPAVGLTDGSAVHVVGLVRHNEAERRQFRVIRGEHPQGLVERGWHVRKIDPRIMLALVVARLAPRVAHRGHRLRVADEGQPHSQ